MASASLKVWNCDRQQYPFAGVWKIPNIHSRKIRVHMESLIGVLQQIQEIVWGPPTMILLLVTGLYYTLRLGFLQFVALPKAIRYIFEKEEGQGVGDVSYLHRCARLWPTIGTGGCWRGYSPACRWAGCVVLDVGFSHPWHGHKICGRRAGHQIPFHNENGEVAGGPMYWALSRAWG